MYRRCATCGNGVCRTTASQQAPLDPAQVHLDPTKRYYISVLPGDAANSFENVNSCLGNRNSKLRPRHGRCPDCLRAFDGISHVHRYDRCLSVERDCTRATQSIPAVETLRVRVSRTTSRSTVSRMAGGGVDVLSPNEPGLGGFNITLFDDAGGTGDATGQMTYDMFNMPLSNSLAGTIDPATGLDACPISKQCDHGL